MKRRIATLAVLLLMAGACGQKSGVHQDVAAGGGGGGELTLDEASSTDVPAAETDAGAAPGEATPGAPAGGGGGAATAGGGGGGGAAVTPSAGATPAASGPAWGPTIVIGIHAPLTGAAPIPAASFERGSGLFAEYINDKGGIHGRKLEIEFLDDEYQPATAVSKCKQLVEQKKAFMLFGAAGTDQIQACARYGATAGVPYVSMGVTEVGMRALKNYFALSMSYPQQGPYLARYIKSNFGGRPLGVVYSNTKNFYDARDAFVAEATDAKQYQMSRLPSQSEIAQTAQRLCGDGIKVANVLISPTTFIALAAQVKSQCGAIQWVSAGLIMGLNSIAATGCDTNEGVDQTVAFSPFPGDDRIASVDPEFKAAVDKFRGGRYDDIYGALWGAVKAISKLLEGAGPNLTRAGFIAASEKASNLASGVFPPLTYSASDHFGAKQVHVLQADCGTRKYRTLQTFASF